MPARPGGDAGPPDRLRCPLCCNDGFHRQPEGWRECTHCEVAFGPRWAEEPEAARRALFAHAEGAVLEPGLAMNPVARRNLAFAVPVDGEPGLPVTLAAIARKEEVSAFLEATQPIAACFAERVLLVDGEAAPPRAPEGVRFLARRFTGDFAAQRNCLMEAVRTDWVLQLDTDETLSRDHARRMSLLAARAEAQGLRALGLPRRNHVDGMLASLYPDIQYRLLRRELRFEGVVHERPIVPFAQTALALSCPIDHMLSRARVVQRSEEYGMMAAGGERVQDEAALHEPMPARWMAFL